jgi:hypothetical protein
MLSLVVGAAAHGQPGRYRAAEIPAFSGSGIRMAYALDGSGRAVGVQTLRTISDGGVFRRLDAGFVAQGGVARAVVPFADGLGTTARGVTASGVIVGWASDGRSSRAAILSPDDPPVFMPLGGLSSLAMGAAVGPAGPVVVGSVTLAGEPRRAFAWSADRGVREFIPVVLSPSTAYAVTDAPAIAGELTAAGGARHAFVVRPGSDAVVDLNGGLAGGWVLEQGFTASGGFIGCNGTLDGVARASVVAVEGPVAPRELRPLAGLPATIVYGVNTRGDAVGLSLVSLALGPRRGTLWPAGGEGIDLAVRTVNVPPGTIWNSVTAVGEDGRVLAEWLTGDGRHLLVTLEPLCAADVDGDGGVTGADLDAFIDRFAGAGPDMNGDGFNDWYDFLAYVDAFESGC